jgi:hypothetical protein
MTNRQDQWRDDDPASVKMTGSPIRRAPLMKRKLVAIGLALALILLLGVRPAYAARATDSPAASSLLITPASVNFQNVGIDTQATATVKLTNASDAKLAGSVSGRGLKGTPFQCDGGHRCVSFSADPDQDGYGEVRAKVAGSGVIGNHQCLD